jgi:hypothetical protein
MPDDGKKGDDQERQPPRLVPTPAHKEIEIPPEVQKLIQARPGFANYYFNELERGRVWAAFVKSGDFSAAAGAWKLTGDMAGAGNVEVTLADAASSGAFPQGAVRLDPMQDLDQELGPAGSGGLLAALHLWRQLLVEGPEKFGDVVYYGTAPHPAVEGQADVLIARRNVAELYLAFDPATGRLAAAEFVADPTDDGCELLFSDYRDLGGRQVAHRLEVRRGDQIFGQIEWKQIELASSSEKRP